MKKYLHLLLLVPVLFVLESNNIGQLVSGTIACMFTGAVLVKKNKTFNVLAILSIINAACHYVLFFPAWSAKWPEFYSMVDLVTILIILEYGDKQRIYQVSLLSIMILLHFLLSFDLTFNSSIVISWYYVAMIVLTLFQFLGSIDVLFSRIIASCYNSCKRYIHNLHPPKSHH